MYSSIAASLPVGSPLALGPGGDVSRYFRLNVGDTDGYETGARLIPDPGAHFDVEFTLLGDVDAGTFIAQNVSSTVAGREFQIYQFSSDVAIVVLRGGLTRFSINLSRGVWRFTNDGTTITMYKNGVLVESLPAIIGTSTEPTATTTFACRHNNGLGAYGFLYEGVIANTVIRNSSGDVVNSYLINEASGSVITDTIGGQDGSVIAGADADRGLFTEQHTLWKGQGLTVPPWDSVSQELLKA